MTLKNRFSILRKYDVIYLILVAMQSYSPNFEGGQLLSVAAY
jgi:hypothetical protein